MKQMAVKVKPPVAEPRVFQFVAWFNRSRLLASSIAAASRLSLEDCFRGREGLTGKLQRRVGGHLDSVLLPSRVQEMRLIEITGVAQPVVHDPETVDEPFPAGQGSNTDAGLFADDLVINVDNPRLVFGWSV